MLESKRLGTDAIKIPEHNLEEAFRVQVKNRRKGEIAYSALINTSFVEIETEQDEDDLLSAQLSFLAAFSHHAFDAELSEMAIITMLGSFYQKMARITQTDEKYKYMAIEKRLVKAAEDRVAERAKAEAKVKEQIEKSTVNIKK